MTITICDSFNYNEVIQQKNTLCDSLNCNEVIKQTKQSN